MQTVHRKYRNHASRTILLLLLFATNGNVLAQTGWIAKNLRAGCAAIAQGVLPQLFGSDSPAAADPQMAITFDDLPAHGALPLGDTRVAVASLESSYLEVAEGCIRYCRGISRTLYGRDIPYVFL
jgi:hypothetical protein